MRIVKEIEKTRLVMGHVWEMQVAKIQSTPQSRRMGADPKDDGKWQATYYHGADGKMWSNGMATKQEAVLDLDVIVDLHFGKEEYEHSS